jgi:hypothetical protein
MLQINHITKYRIEEDPYHISVLRGVLTRSLGTCFEDVHDEVVAAMNDNIATRGLGALFAHIRRLKLI